MGTWPALAIPFPPCLSRKRQTWEHGVCLRFPFPPACRGNGNHGNMACACESLFPLPVEEKAVVGCLRFAFPPACRGKGLPRDSAGLRGWGAHGALQGPEGLRGALQGFRRCGITRDRPKWRFSTTGTRNMTFSIRVCALVMAFSLCLSRKMQSADRRSGRVLVLYVLGSFASLPRPHRPIRAENVVFLLPVEEKTFPEASKCSKRERQGG